MVEVDVAAVSYLCRGRVRHHTTAMAVTTGLRSTLFTTTRTFLFYHGNGSIPSGQGRELLSSKMPNLSTKPYESKLVKVFVFLFHEQVKVVILFQQSPMISSPVPRKRCAAHSGTSRRRSPSRGQCAKRSSRPRFQWGSRGHHLERPGRLRNI